MQELPAWVNAISEQIVLAAIEVTKIGPKKMPTVEIVICSAWPIAPRRCLWSSPSAPEF